MALFGVKKPLNRLLASTSTAAIIIGAILQSAAAQTAAPPQTAEASTDAGTNGVEEVVVTSRKRSEKLLDVPVAVTALSSASIENQGITSLADLAHAVPSLTIDSTISGSGRNDRSFPQYIIRGMTPSSNNNPTTSVFLDNAIVPSGQVDAIDDVERVEVLKGPQSAYFGRETFAGAINVITKDPSDTFGGSVSGLVGSRSYTDFRGTIEGPIIPDKLTARLSLRNYSKDGSYGNQAAVGFKASSDETLGDQSTKSASLELVAKPIDNLKIKAVGLIWNDDDGPSAQGLVLPNQSNCSFTYKNATGTASKTVPYFCGVTPNLIGATPAANTNVDSVIRSVLANTPQPALFNGGDLLDHYGLDRDAYHLSLGIDYAVPSLGFTITSTTATDKQTIATLQDLDNADTSATPTIPGSQSYYNFPFIVEQRFRNIAQDVRIVSDADQRFRYTLGGSYDWVRFDQSLTGAGPGAPGSFPSGSNEAQTIGGYFALAYDIFSELTLNFEGRYQADKQTAYNGNTDTVQLSKTYRDFLPRVSLQYKFVPDVMAYVTYSEGVNPGTFNTGLQSLTAAQLAQAEAQLGATVEVKPEHLENYEIGLKGRFLDGKATLSADLYYDKWKDQIVVGQFTTFNAAGVPNLQTADGNANQSTLKGVEVDASLVPIPRLVITASGAINDTKYDFVNCGTCALINGINELSGTQIPNASKYQAAVGVEYGGTLESLPDWAWFTRADYSYKSGVYDLPANFVKTPATNLLNLRAGVDSGVIRIEAFINNVTNEGAFTNVAPTGNLTSFAALATSGIPETLVVGLPPLRTYGIRAKYIFGYAEPSPPVAESAVPPPEPPPPAAAPAPMPEKQRDFQVFFDFNKASITEAAGRVIQAAADVVKTGGVAHITVTGHTDTVGTAKYNQKLSEERATAVKTQLVTDGVDGGEIASSGVGKSDLLVPTADGVREPQNRRAVIDLQ